MAKLVFAKVTPLTHWDHQPPTQGGGRERGSSTRSILTGSKTNSGSDLKSKLAIPQLRGGHLRPRTLPEDFRENGCFKFFNRISGMSTVTESNF